MECVECGEFLKAKKNASRHRTVCSMTGVVDSKYISRQIENITADVELTSIENRFKQLFNERFNKK